MSKSNAVISIDPEVMSGTPVFAGTRVPIKSLVDHLIGGITLDEFLNDFPTVSREQAIQFLQNSEVLAIAELEEPHRLANSNVEKAHS